MDFSQEIWKQWKLIDAQPLAPSEKLKNTVKQKIFQIESGKKIPIVLFLGEQRIEGELTQTSSCLFLSFSSSISPAQAFLATWKLAVVTRQEIEFIFMYQMPLQINPLGSVSELLNMRDRIMGLTHI